jgi:hypothetical protein
MTAQLSIRFIAETVAEAFGTSYLRIVSPSLAPEVIAARQVTAWLAWRHTALSKAEIGRLVGGRSDVAVIHQIDRVEERRTAEPAFAAEVNAAEVAVLAAGEALRRLAVDTPADPDPVEIAERILSGRAVDVPADALRALAMAALGRPVAAELGPDPGAVIRTGRTLLAALDRCNAAMPGTPGYGRAAVARISAVHAFREALKPFAVQDAETINGGPHVHHDPRATGGAGCRAAGEAGSGPVSR